MILILQQQPCGGYKMANIKKLQDLRTELRTTLGFTEIAREKYVDPLITSTHSPFKVANAPMKEVFVNAVALGYYNKYRIPLEGKMDRNIRNNVFSTNDLSLFLTIAATEESFEVISDMAQISTIMEEYANGGIQPLYKMIFEIDGDPIYTFREKFDNLLTDLMEE